MAMYVPNEQDIRMLGIHSVRLHYRIDLMNERMKKIDSIEGISSDGNLSIDADSDIRRTFSIALVLSDRHRISRYEPSEWINKFLWFYIGVEAGNLPVVWYSKGVYAISGSGYHFDARTRRLQISGVDLVAKLNGDLAGQLTGLATKIPASTLAQDEGIEKAIIETLQLAGFDKCFVDYWNRSIPYDLTYDTGATVWSILTELRDLYYPFEMYFDEDMFVCKEIPSGCDDPVILSADSFDRLVISENPEVDYAQVRNCVEMFGASVAPDGNADSVTVTGRRIVLNTTDADLSDGKKISFLVNGVPDGANGYELVINNTVTLGEDQTLGPFPIYDFHTDEAGNYQLLKNGRIENGKQYLVRCAKSQKRFYFIGKQQIHAMVMLKDEVPGEAEYAALKAAENCDNLKIVCTADPDNYDDFYKSRFSMERIGRKNLVLSGGEYDNYSNDADALDVAQFMLWKNARLTDVVTVNMLVVPWLDVNQKVEYTAQYLGGEKPAQYIVKKINYTIGEGEMTVELMRFYPYYPYIVKNK